MSLAASSTPYGHILEVLAIVEDATTYITNIVNVQNSSCTQY
jgi:hypothetical protein